MKKCGYCGWENANDAVACRECGASLLPDAPVKKISFRRIVTNRIKLTLYFAAWGAVVVAAFFRNPSDLLAAPMFPVGLAIILPPERAIETVWMGGLSLSVLGWFLYGLLTVFLNRTNRLGIFLVLYLLLCGLLVLNFVGCGQLIRSASGIH